MVTSIQTITGPVVHGFKRGRDLGFPTANVELTGDNMPEFGVYAARVDVPGGDHIGAYSGCASVGSRPMFGKNVPNLEVFILDFKGDLYGQEIRVELVEYLRPELVFDELDALIEAMGRDVKMARAILAEPTD